MSATTLIAIITMIQTVINALFPSAAASQTGKTIDNIITTLEALLPDIVNTVTDLVEPVKNIIAALKGTDGITPEQWAALDTYEQQIDAAFDAAAKDEGL